MSTPKNILVIDVEATCWENNTTHRNEIIEIGLAVINLKSRQITEARSIIVHPSSEEITEFCTKLTTLTPKFVQAMGVSFPEALDILSEYKPNKQIFASWGDYDRKAFEKNCVWNRVRYPFGPLHLNVKALFAASHGYTGGQEACGNHVGIAMEGTAHRGIHDAVNIAKILLTLI